MRIEKINQLIKREISNMLLYGDINDPRLSFVTIMEVDTSRDLQHARVKFSVLTDDEKEIKNVQDGLDSARGFIRKMISQRIDLRYTPEIVFIHDRSLQYQAQIDRTITEIKNERHGKGEDA